MKVQNVLRLDYFTFSFAVVLIAIFGLFHQQYTFWQERSCSHTLLDTGRFRTENAREWMPDGCVLKNYTQRDVRYEIEREEEGGRQNNIILMGDSRLRHLYDAFGNLISPDPMPVVRGMHVGRFYQDRTLNLTIQFYWTAYPDGRDLNALITNWKTKGDYPRIFILGFALHPIGYGKNAEQKLEEYKRNLTEIAENLDWLSRRSLVAWYVQPAVNPLKAKKHLDFEKNPMLIEYNKAAKEILSKTHVKWWGAVRSLSAWHLNDYIDDIHVSKITNTYFPQMIFNVLFNKRLQIYEEDQAQFCCRHLIFSFQNLLLPIVILICLIVYITLCLLKKKSQKSSFLKPALLADSPVKQRQSNTEAINTIDEVLEIRSIVNIENGAKDMLVKKIATKTENKELTENDSKNEAFRFLDKFKVPIIVFILLSICERTSFFSTVEQVNLNSLELCILCIIFAILSIVSMETETEKDLTSKQNADVISRNITDEWKGWMQVVLMILKFSGREWPTSFSVRLIVSSFLFLTGFGHSSYFLQGGESSLIRYFKVFLRTNLVPLAMCLTLGQSYYFYHFLPLVTLWTIILFIFFKLPPKIDLSGGEESLSLAPWEYVLLGCKCLLFIDLSYTFSLNCGMIQQGLEQISPSLLWTTFFGDETFCSRWNDDMFTVFYGVTFAFIYQSYRNDSKTSSCTGANNLRCIVSFVFGVLVLSSSLEFINFYGRSRDYLNIYSYIVWVPILGYILIRCSIPSITSRTSKYLRNIGKMSLELYICQQHLLTSSMSTGVLSLFPGSSLLNFLFLFVVNIWISLQLVRLKRYVIRGESKFKLFL